MKKEVFFILTLFLILIPLISAVAPLQTNVNINVGLDIDFPKIEVIEEAKDFTFHFHVFNRSNGLRLDNTTTNCSFELYNNTGEVQLTRENIKSDDNHWFVLVSGGNFSRLGIYEYLVDCSSTGFGGFASLGFEVTPTGTILETSDSITYLILIGGVLFLFLFCLYGGIVLPFRNQRDNEGKIISVQKLKYFKLVCLFTSYILFVWLLNLFLALSTNFSILPQYTKFFEVIFSVVNSMSYPIFVLMFVSFLFLAWKDLALKKLLERGINPN